MRPPRGIFEGLIADEHAPIHRNCRARPSIASSSLAGTRIRIWNATADATSRHGHAKFPEEFQFSSFKFWKTPRTIPTLATHTALVGVVVLPVPDHRILFEENVTRPMVQERTHQFKRIHLREKVQHSVQRRHPRNFVRSAKERTTIQQTAGRKSIGRRTKTVLHKTACRFQEIPSLCASRAGKRDAITCLGAICCRHWPALNERPEHSWSVTKPESMELASLQNVSGAASTSTHMILHAYFIQ